LTATRPRTSRQIDSELSGKLPSDTEVPRVPNPLDRAEEEFAMFKQNVGAVDRIIRIVVGLVLIALVFVGPKTAWGWIGLVPLITGIVRTCPAYSLLGIATNRS
jgi:hypothetical protein